MRKDSFRKISSVNVSLKESKFYKATNRHFEEIKKLVKLWLEPLEERMFYERSRQKIFDAMKGQESEKKLSALMPTEKLQKTFHEQIEVYMKGTRKEKTLSRDEWEQLLVRKILELTNPNSEYDILLFQKVRQIWKCFTNFTNSFLF